MKNNLKKILKLTLLIITLLLIHCKVSAAVDNAGIYVKKTSNYPTGKFVITREEDKNIPAGDAAITLAKSTDGWTNGDVIITGTINLPESERGKYYIELSPDGTNWIKADTATVNGNGRIYARLSNGIYAGEAKYIDINNIDKTAPTNTAPEATSTTNSITATYKQTDSGSGIKVKKYRLTNADGTTGEWIEATDDSYTFRNLTAGTTYYIQTYAEDNAGNVITSNITPIQTRTVPTGEGNITLTPSTTGWTNGSITVTANSSVPGYTIQTSIDGINWGTTNPLTVTGNGTIYARLYDGENYGGIKTYTISNYDNLGPTYSSYDFINPTDTSVDMYIYGVNDDGSGVKSVKYRVWLDGTNKDDAELKDGTNNGNGTWFYPIDLDNYGGTKGKYNIEAIIEDNAGNTTTINTSKTFEEERTALSIGGTKIDTPRTVEALTDYYGQTVDFTSVDGVTWQLFYDDEDYYYLIASYYAPVNTLPDIGTVKEEQAEGDTTKYRAGFDVDTITSNEKWSQGSAAVAVPERKHLNWINSHPESTNQNMQIVAYMLDTDVWKNFAGDIPGAKAYGGPTFEMFIKSYNTKNSSKIYAGYDTITSDNSNDYGYRVRMASSDWYFLNQVELNYGNMWIFNHNRGAYGYYIASPGYGGATEIYQANYSEDRLQRSGAFYDSYVYTSAFSGFRPVVSIPKKSATDGIPSGNTAITLTPSTTDWTNGSVTVTASTTLEGYTIQTSTDAKNWSETNPVVVTGVGTVYARLYDGTNYGGAVTYALTKYDNVAPTYTSYELKNATETTVDIYINGVSDSKSGIKTVKYKIWFDTESENSAILTNGTNNEDGTWTYTLNINDYGNKKGKYNIKVIIEDNAGNTTEIEDYKIFVENGDLKISGTKIETPKTAEALSSYYGQTVDFTPIEGIDWQLFYDDEDYYYVVASDYVKKSLLPSELNKEINTDEYFACFATDSSNYNGACLDNEPWNNGSSAISTSSKKYLKWADTYSTSKNVNIRATAFMLDESKWSLFAGGVAGAKAYGGPTLEMFVKSYNLVFPSTNASEKLGEYDTINSNNSNSKGYLWQSQSWGNSWGYSNIYIKKTNAMFTPEYSNRAYTWYLASPSGSRVDSIMCVSTSSGILYSQSAYGGTMGFRPLVALPKK